jgi:DNA-binding MarR family transcriptional regulator
MSMGELAAVTLVQQSTVSRVVARMEGDGLVTRRARDDDGRIVEARITESGEDKLDDILRIVAIQYARAVEGIDEADLDRLRATLSAMLSNLTRSPFA